ncbi:MAG TPA: serine hydroxymethyltransferase [Candidatus Thermoplasmatota archaeon]
MAIQAHEQFRSRTLNLQASENLMSPAARAALASDMASRYSLRLDREWDGVYYHNAYGGTLWMEEVEEEARSLAQEVFGARHALVEPVGGHAAAMVALLAATPRGGLVASTPQSGGGYTGYDKEYLPAMFGMRAAEFPFDKRRWTVDLGKLPAFLRKAKPDTLLLGASYLLFPYDLPAVHDACDDADQHPVLLYDGSHVMGLIAGGTFQRPLAEGVLALHGSTHKSFFGPQGGLFLTNDDEVAAKAKENLTWRTMDNAHESRIAALAVALAEMAHFGRSYAHRVVDLARALAEALDKAGMPVRFRSLGYTESHQILLDDVKVKSKFGFDTAELSATLERSSIIVDAVGRIGTAELARTGAMPDEMEELAALIVKAAKGKRVKAEVEEYRSMLPAPAFTFD